MKSSTFFRIIAIIGGALLGYNIGGAINGYTNNSVLFSSGLIVTTLASFGMDYFMYKEK